MAAEAAVEIEERDLDERRSSMGIAMRNSRREKLVDQAVHFFESQSPAALDRALAGIARREALETLPSAATAGAQIFQKLAKDADIKSN